MSATETKDPDGPEIESSSMGIDPYERNWIRVSLLLLVVFAATIGVAGFAQGFQVPDADRKVDPRTVLDQDPWADPGLREIAPGVYEAYVVAQMWAFIPRELTVPVGAEVTIFVTSPDVQHGFMVTETNINMQVVPGEVSRLTYTFDEVGEFPYICHEYCGRGHAAMFGVVNVVSEADFATDSSDEGSDEGALP